MSSLQLRAFVETADAAPTGLAHPSRQMSFAWSRRPHKWTYVPANALSRKDYNYPAATPPDVVSTAPGLWGECGVQSVAVLSGGEHVLTTSRDGMVRMSSVIDGSQRWEVQISRLKRVSGANVMNDVATWRTRSRRRRRSIPVTLLNADVLVTGSACLSSWSVHDGAPIAELQVGPTGVYSIARLDDRRFVAGCDDGSLVFCEHSHVPPRVFEIFYVVGHAQLHSSRINDISVLGNLVATASDDKTAGVWDTKTHTRIALLTGHTCEVDSVALSESLVVTGSSGTQSVRIYSVENHYSLMSDISSIASVHRAAVFSVDFLDSEHIVTVSVDNMLAISSIKSDKVLTRLQFDYNLNSIAPLASGYIACFGTGVAVVRLPDSSSRERLETLIAKRSKEVSAAETEYRKRRDEAHREALQASGPWEPEVTFTSPSGDERLKCIEVLPDADRVVTLSSDGTLRAWRTSMGSMIWWRQAHTGAVGRRALTTLGREIIATGGYTDSFVRTWSSERGTAIGALKVGRCGIFVLLRLGSWRFVVGCGNGNIVFCKHNKGMSLTMMYEVSASDAHTASVTDLSVRGTRLASSSIDKTAAVWDTETCSKLAALRGHIDWVLCVDISDRFVVSGSRSAPYVRVYDIAREYACLSAFGAVSWIHNDAVTSLHILDRERVLSTSGDMVCIWGLQSDEVFAKVRSSSGVLSLSLLPSGHVAAVLQGENEIAGIFPVPREAYHVLRNYSAARNCENLAASDLALLAGGICEKVRAECQVAEQVRKVCSDATNFDTCMDFVAQCHRWRNIAGKNGRVSVAFHGTRGTNMTPIIESSLRAPDGVDVRVQNGQCFGKGIYVSTKSELAFQYSKHKPIFACLITIGSLKNGFRGSTPAEQGCDTFQGKINDTVIYVLQCSSQVLPCLTVDADSVAEANRILQNLVVFIEQNL